jgi:hypothetical protein
VQTIVAEAGGASSAFCRSGWENVAAKAPAGRILDGGASSSAFYAQHCQWGRWFSSVKLIFRPQSAIRGRCAEYHPKSGAD